MAINAYRLSRREKSRNRQFSDIKETLGTRSASHFLTRAPDGNSWLLVQTAHDPAAVSEPCPSRAVTAVRSTSLWRPRRYRTSGPEWRTPLTSGPPPICRCCSAISRLELRVRQRSHRPMHSSAHVNNLRILEVSPSFQSPTTIHFALPRLKSDVCLDPQTSRARGSRSPQVPSPQTRSLPPLFNPDAPPYPTTKPTPFSIKNHP